MVSLHPITYTGVAASCAIPKQPLPVSPYRNNSRRDCCGSCTAEWRGPCNHDDIARGRGARYRRGRVNVDDTKTRHDWISALALCKSTSAAMLSPIPSDFGLL